MLGPWVPVKGVNLISKDVLVWLADRYILVSVNINVPFQVYSYFLYLNIYIYIYNKNKCLP